MEQIISSCHSVIKYNNNYYCAWNDKHKKYAPIGGKTDAGETELMTLAREINEEVTVKGYKSIERLGVHVHEALSQDYINRHKQMGIPEKEYVLGVWKGEQDDNNSKEPK